MKIGFLFDIFCQRPYMTIMNRYRLFSQAFAGLRASSWKSGIAICALLFIYFLSCASLTVRLGSAGAEGARLIASLEDDGSLVPAGHVKGQFSQEHLSHSFAALEENKAAGSQEETRLVPHSLPSHLITEWYGGKAMERESLRRTLRYVTKTLKPDGEWCTPRVHDLLMETAAVETALGEIVRQKNGPALSVWQILGFNFEEIREYFGKRDPELLARAMQFYNPNLSEEWNRVHNVPWTAAMSLLFYEKASRGNFLSRLDTLDSRGRLWKQLYNTRLGKGTVKGYKQRAREYVHVEVETS